MGEVDVTTNPADRRGSERSAAVHLPGLDGLRGVAVVAVVAYHLGWLPGGFLGVDVFFVLSGYLVTTTIFASLARTGRVGLLAFWARRIRRLAPLALVVVAAVLIAAMASGWPRRALDEAAVDGFATLTWWANWRQASGPGYWSTTPSLFRHAWSLSVEEQFYAGWPLVVAAAVAVAGRLRWRASAAVGWSAAALAVASAGWMVALAGRTGELARVYVGTDTRMFAPLAGCALAAWWPPGRRPGRFARRAVPLLAALGTAALVLLMVRARVSEPGLYRRGGFVAAAVASGAVLVSVSRPGTRLLDVRGLRWLGVRAYGLYLWSWPVQVLAEHRWPEAGRWAVTAIVVGLALPLAALSHRLVEEPLRRPTGWARRPVPRRVAWVGAPVVAALVVVAAHGLAVPPPAHETVSTEEALDAALHAPPPPPRVPAPTTAPVAADERSSAPPPTAVPAPPDLRVLVLGDSLAFTAHYYAAGIDIDGIASIDGRSIMGCGVLAAHGWDYEWGDEGFVPAGACRQQLEAEQVGFSGDPDVVVLMPGAWESVPVRSPTGEVVPAQSDRMSEVLVEALLDRARSAHEVGARTAIVAWACPGEATSPPLRDPAYTRWLNGVIHRTAQEGAAEGMDVSVVEPTEAVCVDGDPTGTPTEAKDAATAREIHLHDAEGARWYWSEWLVPALTGRPPTTPG